MIKLYTFLLTLFVSLSAAAQQDKSEQPTQPKTKLFIGGGLSTTHYQVKGDPKYGDLSVIPNLSVHFGYQFSKRAIVQIGLATGSDIGSSFSYRRYSADSIYVTHNRNIVRAIATPLTVKFTPFNPQKRLQVYTNVTLAPVFSQVQAKLDEIVDSELKSVYDEEMYSFNLVSTAGLTANYRLGPRVDAYVDTILLYLSLHNRSKDMFPSYLPVGIGINYRL